MSKKKSMKVVVLTILMIVGFEIYLVYTMVKEPIYSSYVFPVLSQIPVIGWLVAYNFPPDDFYCPLSVKPLKLGSHELEFSCKYKGRHEIRIQKISDMRFWECNVGMTVTIRDEVGHVFYESNIANSIILGGAGGLNYNYCFGIFYAPDDVPIGSQLTARITCYGEVDELLGEFPEAEIAIVKAFDK